MTFLTLVFVHLLADYPLQGDFLAKMKGQNLIALFTHCGIWTGCVFVAAHFLGLKFGGEVIFIMFGIHAVADYWKANGGYGKSDPFGWPLLVDQAIHIGQVAIIAALK